jgi:hypothetical protein
MKIWSGMPRFRSVVLLSLINRPVDSSKIQVQHQKSDGRQIVKKGSNMMKLQIFDLGKRIVHRVYLIATFVFHEIRLYLSSLSLKKTPKAIIWASDPVTRHDMLLLRYFQLVGWKTVMPMRFWFRYYEPNSRYIKRRVHFSIWPSAMKLKGQGLIRVLKSRQLFRILYSFRDIEKSAEDAVLIPFGMHPVHYVNYDHNGLVARQCRSRKTRVLFAGSIAGGHRQAWYAATWGTPNRADLIKLMIAEFRPNQDRSRVSQCQFSVIDLHKLKIRPPEYLDLIADADFFICLPGAYMPVCHHATESLCVGTIPIINYPHLYSPQLKHGCNCLVWNDVKSLLSAIQLALDMNSDDVRAMRERVIEYSVNLTPSSVVQMLCNPIAKSCLINKEAASVFGSNTEEAQN